MQRLLDSLQVTAYLVGIAVVIYAGIHATTVLAEISAGLKQDRLAHEQMLKDHIQQLQDHERQMERR